MEIEERNGLSKQKFVNSKENFGVQSEKKKTVKEFEKQLTEF